LGESASLVGAAATARPRSAPAPLVRRHCTHARMQPLCFGLTLLASGTGMRQWPKAMAASNALHLEEEDMGNLVMKIL